MNVTEDNKNYLTAFLKSFDFEKFKKAVLEVNEKHDNGKSSIAVFDTIVIPDGAVIDVQLNLDHHESYDGDESFAYSVYLFKQNGDMPIKVDWFGPIYSEGIRLSDEIESRLYATAHTLLSSVEKRLREITVYLNSLNKLNEKELDFLNRGWGKIPEMYHSICRKLGDNVYSFVTVQRGTKETTLEITLNAGHKKNFELSSQNPNGAYRAALLSFRDHLINSVSELSAEIERCNPNHD